MFERLLQDKGRLRHRPLGCIDDEQNAVDHIQNALHLSAEIMMSRGVDDIDHHIAVDDRGVLRHDRDAAFSFQLVAVHHLIDRFLIVAVKTGRT